MTTSPLYSSRSSVGGGSQINDNRIADDESGDHIVINDDNRTEDNDDDVKKEIVAMDGDAYFGEADYSFENSYDSYNSYPGGGSGGQSSGYSYSDGHLCKLCGKYYKSAGSLKNHRSLYHRSEIGKNRAGGLTSADGVSAGLDQSMPADDFALDHI